MNTRDRCRDGHRILLKAAERLFLAVKHVCVPGPQRGHDGRAVGPARLPDEENGQQRRDDADEIYVARLQGPLANEQQNPGQRDPYLIGHPNDEHSRLLPLVCRHDVKHRLQRPFKDAGPPEHLAEAKNDQGREGSANCHDRKAYEINNGIDEDDGNKADTGVEAVGQEKRGQHRRPGRHSHKGT